MREKPPRVETYSGGLFIAMALEELALRFRRLVGGRMGGGRASSLFPLGTSVISGANDRRILPPRRWVAWA